MTGRWKLGLALALLTATLWGLLPIALTVALKGLDPYTLTWYRFTAAGLILGSVLVASRAFPSFESLNQAGWWKLGIALAGLTGNYVLFLLALKHSSPTIAQTLSQVSVLFLLLGGLIVYKERFSGRQWIGFGLLLGGLCMFFNQRFADFHELSSGLGLGVVFGLTGALIWAAYGLAQKRLLLHLGSQQILVLIYIGASLVLLPFASPGAIRSITRLQFGMLVFSCFNTLFAYGAFAESQRHWQVSRVSAILALTPLLTLLAMWLVERSVPHLVAPEELNWKGVIGAGLVVAGSVACALERVTKADIS